jgi:hypothetical protein
VDRCGGRGRAVLAAREKRQDLLALPHAVRKLGGAIVAIVVQTNARM